YALFHFGETCWRNGLLQLLRSGAGIVSIKQMQPHGHVLGRAGPVLNLHRDLHRRAGLADIRRGDGDAPLRYADFACRIQPHVPVDSRPGIPAAVLAFVTHSHRKYVLAGPAKVRRQIIREGRVTIRMRPKQLAVQPDIAVAVHAIEGDLHLSICWHRRRRKATAIPTSSPYEPARVTAALT